MIEKSNKQISIKRQCDLVSIASSTIFPNPTHNYVTIAYKSEAEGNFKVYLMDVLGRNVLQSNGMAQEGENKIELNLDKLHAGIYTVHLINGDYRSVKKLIKE